MPKKGKQQLRTKFKLRVLETQFFLFSILVNKFW